MRILNYHSVSEATDDPIIGIGTVPPALFRKQLNILSKFGFKFITPQQFLDILVKKLPFPKNALLLTFDDGYKDFLQNAFPVLADNNMLAIVFIVTGFVGEKNHWDIKEGAAKKELLNLEALKKLETKGIMLGAHSLSHPDLCSLSPEELKKEIFDTIPYFIENGLKKPSFFLYPYGSYNLEVVKTVVEAGFLGAFSTDCGILSTQSNIFLLPRIPVRKNDYPVKLLFRVWSGGITDGLLNRFRKVFNPLFNFA